MPTNRKIFISLIAVPALLIPGLARAQALVPPHLLGDLSDFKPMMVLTGILVGMIPALILMKSAEAVGRRWENVAGRTIALSLGGCAFGSLIATVWFWGWVL
jgi:hypothetical protein